MTKTSLTGAFTGFLLLSTASLALAAPQSIKANLTGTAETPPNDSKGSGSLTGTYDPETHKLTYEVTYSGLTGPAVAAHFHAPAPVGKPAGIEVPVKGSVESPIKGEATLTDAQAKNLTDGMTYFNIHTAKNRAGELRGQVNVGE